MNSSSRRLDTAIRTAVAALLLAIGLPVHAVPLLQLYVEGADYNQDHESWVFDSAGDPIRLWVIGNVAGPGGKGPLSNVRLAVTYANAGAGTDLDVTLTPTTAGGVGSFMGFDDPSTPQVPTFNGLFEDGRLPVILDNKTVAPHGVYGPGWEWQEFALGDMVATDSPIADFIDSFPMAPSQPQGQINVYEVSVSSATLDRPIDLHFDAYGWYSQGGGFKATFAPYSHDAGTGINEPDDVPAPAAWLLLLLGLGLVAFAGRYRAV